MNCGGLLNKHIREINSNISNDETAETINFHYKSMGTISCHRNQSSYMTIIKKTNNVEANVMNMYAKYQFFPPNCF